MNPSDYVNLRGAAAIAGCDPMTILAAIRRGELKALRIEGTGTRPTWAIKRTDAENFKPRPPGRPPKES